MMKKNKFVKSFTFLIFSGLFIPACDAVDQTQYEVIPTINYTVSGGFGGGTRTKLSIDPGGIATLESTYPNLKIQLSHEEHLLLLSNFHDFGILPDSFTNQCADGFIYAIERKGADYSKSIEIDDCTLESNEGVIVKKIKNIILNLEKLESRIYQTKVPWKGLIADFSIDSEIYDIGEPITFRYRISNPTSEERVIYFRHKNQFWFSLNKINFPSFNYSYPVMEAADSSAGSEIHFNPGEKKEIIYVWNPPSNSRTRDIAIGVGNYALNMNLLAGDLPTKTIFFEVIDKKVPISGLIIEDPNGESSSSPTYNFTLSIRNWTNSPVTLNFPSSQTINIELFDLDKPTSGQLLYSGPIVTDSVSTTVTLSPGESRIFTHTAQKSNFARWYMWTYVKIRLLATNFEFKQDGHLRIFPFR